MAELTESIAMPKYTPGMGYMNGSGPPGGMNLGDNSDIFSNSFFGFNTKGLFPVTPITFGGSKASFGLTKHRKKAKKVKKTKKPAKKTKKSKKKA